MSFKTNEINEEVGKNIYPLVKIDHSLEIRINKAMYTATPVTFGWAGAVVKLLKFLAGEYQGPSDKQMDGRMDGRVDERTKRSVESRNTRLEIFILTVLLNPLPYPIFTEFRIDEAAPKAF